jgi:hypothetical protein
MKIAAVLILACIASFSLHHHDLPLKTPLVSNSKKKLTREEAFIKIKNKSTEAQAFARRNHFNKEVCFLVDMSIFSGSKRFFIYSFKKDSIIASALVAHGNCFQYWLEGRQYSNKIGSGCTSLGKYKIGASYTGKFGYSFKLHGLDSSNSNAFERTVVLHSYHDVPDNESTDEICQSNGCPMVSPAFFNKLKEIINHSTRPILLWIYN